MDALEFLAEPARVATVRGRCTNYMFLIDADVTRELCAGSERKISSKRTFSPDLIHVVASRNLRLQPGVDLIEQLENLGDVSLGCGDEREQRAAAYPG